MLHCDCTVDISHVWLLAVALTTNPQGTVTTEVAWLCHAQVSRGCEVSSSDGTGGRMY